MGTINNWTVPLLCSGLICILGPKSFCSFINFTHLFNRSIFQTFWKVHCCPDFSFLELETSNLGYLNIFLFSLNVQSFSKIGQHWYLTFYNGPPMNFWQITKLKNIKGGTLIKCFKSMFSNPNETLHI